MPAPKGHKMWGNPVKPKLYTPGELWEGAIAYFKWCDQNPIKVVEQSKVPQRLSDGMVKTLKPNMLKAFMSQTVELPHQRAYSIEGMCIYLNMSTETFRNYQNTEGYETYFEVSKRIREIIDTQHFEGGMAGIFNANIATRKLGLVDKGESTHNFPNTTIVVQSQAAKDALESI